MAKTDRRLIRREMTFLCSIVRARQSSVQPICDSGFKPIGLPPRFDRTAIGTSASDPAPLSCSALNLARSLRERLCPYASACYPRMFLASQAAPAFENTLPHVWYTCVHGVSMTSAEERGNSTLTGSHGFYLKAMAKFLHASV